MIDHMVGRPSPSWKRIQVFIVIVFWSLHASRTQEPPTRWLARFNQRLEQFTPWQIIVGTLTGVYAVRNLDKILGLGSPEPLARLYSRSYYRVTWINTALDAGFATAMGIRPKWFKDICSVLFAVYYLVYANEADEKLRRFRAVCTLDMLRTTWEKTTNPYIRAFTLMRLPQMSIRRKVILSRPRLSVYKEPITAWLFFAPPADQLSSATDLILDFPGGGFVAMSPLHHEERLRRWANRTGKPVLSVDYGKAPEHPYPFAIEEGFDVYRLITESGGQLLGMSSKKLGIIISGDSAGANIAVNVMTKLLEAQTAHRHPLALVLNYPALDFNFTSWMSPTNLAVLRTEQSSGAIDRLVNPRELFASGRTHSTTGNDRSVGPLRKRTRTRTVGQVESYETALNECSAHDRPISQHAHLQHAEVDASKPSNEHAKRAPVGTRLTITSRTGYFQDRIISPSMMRAMAIMYIGLKRNPDFERDYYISPILTPSHLLARFPSILIQCGEKDPFVDDSVIFAGRVREAKRARKAELERILASDVGVDGESSRTTTSSRNTRLQAEYQHLSQQNEDEWVDLQIFAEWSHGYLQMSSLMSEAGLAIDDIADWISDTFSSQQSSREPADSGVVNPAHLGDSQPFNSAKGSERRRSSAARSDADYVLFESSRKEGDTARQLLSVDTDDDNKSAEASGVGGTVEQRCLSSATGNIQGGRSVGLMDDKSGRAVLDRSTAPTLTGNGNGAVRVLGSGTGSKPGQAANAAGLVISEGELMRRRRLLDAHIFET